MSEDSRTTPAEKAADSEQELSLEELDEISGGSGSAKRNAYNAAQQPWQATIP